jgi:hypothetical protein
MKTRTRGFTDKRYHLDGNLWVAGFRSVCDTYDETMEHYEFQKYKDNPRYLEIVTELCCSFLGSVDMIPIDIIGNFAGFEEDDMPKDPGWFLGICAKSNFIEEESAYTKKFNGPTLEWYKDAMIWWWKNEPHRTGDLESLAIAYTNYCIRERNGELMKICKFQTNFQNLNESIVRYILQVYTPYNLMALVNNMPNLEAFFLFYFAEATGLEYYREYVENEHTSENNKYTHGLQTKLVETINNEMKKYL